METSTGDYILHSDSDDWMDNVIVERLMEKVIGDDLKKTLYAENNIKYVDGANMHEDVRTMLRIFAVANNI